MDNYSVKLLSRALRDLDGIYAYIAKTLQEPETALRMVEELEAQILSLETMPYRCAERRTGAYAGKDYRQLFVKNYTVIFRIDEKEKQVIIVTVRYSRSQF
ncbi:MAG: type II toxin-antitoxin system RelE/ParE family toxin [Neglectibacter timonensis]